MTGDPHVTHQRFAAGNHAPDRIVVRRVGAHDGDADLVEQVADLVNEVYAVAESGLWRDDTTRTTAREVSDLIDRGEIVAATKNAELVGSVRIHDVADDVSEFGLLVSAPAHRGSGVGRALLDHIERDRREAGMRTMRLEVLVPRDWTHPSKEFLKDWYGRRGYRPVRTSTLDDAYPHLAPLLATPCDLEIHEKPLR
jgi:GNAT superfamily N-acetyltransferase